jgi:hypothetical protein
MLSEMSRTNRRATRPLQCSGFRFAEVELPSVTRPRIVIEFREGFSLLLADEAAIPMAAKLIAACRKELEAKGGRP